MEVLSDKRFVIAGGSGFLGTSLAQYLTEAGAKVTVLARRQPRNAADWQFELWDGRTVGAWASTLDGADGVVNLAGRTVGCIKTPDHQDEILRSRVESTRVLGQAMRSISTPPPVWVQMSTAHIYGDPPAVRCDEGSAYGYGLAPFVAKQWEAEFEASRLPEQRGVAVRTSFVIGIDRGAGGGALGTLGMLARIGLGGRVASGTQGMSWIHELDMNRIFVEALLNDSMSGPYIASSPNPVSQVQFMRLLRNALGMPIGLPAFEWMVRIGAPLLLKTDPELALYGRYVVPKRLQDSGFEFRWPDLAEAFKDLLS
jgi:uncharacterized protein (TIGR01777 family)